MIRRSPEHGLRALRTRSRLLLATVPVVVAAVVAFASLGAIAGLRDPDLIRPYMNDVFVTVLNLAGLLVIFPYVLFLTGWVLLGAIGRVPVLVLYERDGVRYVATVLGRARLSRHRLALGRGASVRAYRLTSDPLGRQFIRISSGGRRIQAQTFGELTPESLTILDGWVAGQPLDHNALR